MFRRPMLHQYVYLIATVLTLLFVLAAVVFALFL